MDLVLQKWLIKLSMLNTLFLLILKYALFEIRNGVMIQCFTFISHLNNEDNSTAKPLGKQGIAILTLAKWTEQGSHFADTANTRHHFFRAKSNNSVTFSIFFCNFVFH